jgi:hypothetical protein
MDGRIIPFLFAKEPLGMRVWSLAAGVLLLRSLVLLITFTGGLCVFLPEVDDERVSCRRNCPHIFFVELGSTPRCPAVPRRNMDTAAKRGASPSSIISRVEMEAVLGCKLQLATRNSPSK